MYTIIAGNDIIHEDDPDSLRRLSSGRFVREVSQIPSFEFTVFAANPCYNDLHDRKTIVEIHNGKTNETDFEGVLIQTKEDVTSAGKVYKTCLCEGYLGYLCDSVQPYHHYENYTITDFLTAVLDYHNSVTPEEKHIYLGTCDFSGDNTNSKTTSYRTTLEEIKINLQQRVGGEIRIRKIDGRLVLDFVKQYGVKSDTTIELAKNIQTLNVSTDSTSIITRLVPLGVQLNDETAERLTIAEVNGGCPYIDDEAAIAKYGVIMGTVTFDDITMPENLIKRGKDYLENNDRVKKAYAAQILDLSLIDSSQDSIKEGNTYHFRHPMLGLDEDLRLLKISVDIYKPWKPDIEIGDKAERITDIATRTAQLIEYEMPQQKLDILASAKATATALIEAGINGYVVVNKNEILIMDTPDKETATRVWRWNSGGFGYSSTGYHGTYGTAITMDGAITADFITAGVLRGLEIVNGDDTFHVDTDGRVSASAIDITGGSINIATNSEDYDVVQLSCGDWEHSISPLEWRLKNESIACEIRAQAGAMYFNHNGETKIQISTETGNIYCNDLWINRDGTSTSVSSELAYLRYMIDWLTGNT